MCANDELLCCILEELYLPRKQLVKLYIVIVSLEKTKTGLFKRIFAKLCAKQEFHIKSSTIVFVQLAQNIANYRKTASFFKNRVDKSSFIAYYNAYHLCINRKQLFIISKTEQKVTGFTRLNLILKRGYPLWRLHANAE